MIELNVFKVLIFVHLFILSFIIHFYYFYCNLSFSILQNTVLFNLNYLIANKCKVLVLYLIHKSHFRFYFLYFSLFTSYLFIVQNLFYRLNDYCKIYFLFNFHCFYMIHFYHRFQDNYL